jgi:hypothetical protein
MEHVMSNNNKRMIRDSIKIFTSLDLKRMLSTYRGEAYLHFFNCDVCLTINKRIALPYLIAVVAYILTLPGGTNLTWSQSYQTFFFIKRRFFLLFAIKLGHFIAQTIFPYTTNSQA